ncbi:glycerol-3-phosphate dehydrogenase/oxidase [Actinomadura madurae]|uniref:glycerol-3-phosphate dehydrogenase/oxidase n=1 Tax=Actinomadura madurae TaxID=1993 RepID=UPI0020268C37|nr:glycerol-3-phosphate dehydrogenase/oxidase [Actinomadura madurae]MCP9985028.1 glycerol-3-phosphate dehydrogenase/oxidase [Actinomadura madurae]MCQ0021250.1 glycerol-3-phosphate dehydrogenase/oxidase [Actinomadura madurae]URN01254.1 glycerol-3-phosphate dehydrogenase/oxidase [Actinomadura madurae]URN03362.1 glycerol-3-phosphate dehydrogenase/oxidase [Actinomadura madurae]
MTSVALGPQYREDTLRDLADTEFDVLVVGGGIVGAGAALDAISRGLSVALVEARDWAAGTSGRSSKLIHGGLRYLEQRDFGLVREALRERGLLLHRLAPHLVRPVQFLYPLRNRVWERAYVSAGVTLYDTMGGARSLPRHRQLTRRGALREAPALRSDALVGAVQYYDAQVDDARYTMMVARTAAQYGASVATRAEVTGFLREGERVTGARVLDLEGNREIDVRARSVVCATGVWTDGAQAMTGSRPAFGVQASKGVHLVVPRDRIPMDTGLITRTSKSVLFIIPWGRHWLVGTTDTPHEDGPDGPVAEHTDIGYLLDQANAVLRTPLTHDDIEGVYAGLRPLLSGEMDDTTRLSREHAVAEPVPGLVVVTGGKFTTYRVMARDAVDVVAERLDDSVPASVTGRLPILGATGFEVLWNERRRLASESGLHVARVEHLLRRYGACARDVLRLVADSSALGAPIPGAEDYLCAEAVYAVTHEGALRLEDVLARRLRVSIEEWDGGVAAASRVAELIAPVLGWSDEDVADEIKRYVLWIASERRGGPVTEEAPVTAA